MTSTEPSEHDAAPSPSARSRATVVVGLDGSVPGHAAVRWAADLVRRLGGRLVVVHAVESLLPRPAGGRVIDVEWVEHIVASGVELELELVSGAHAERLREAAERESAFLVVIGTDPERPSETARRLTSGSDRPVVLVPRDGRASVHPLAGPWSLST